MKNRLLKIASATIENMAGNDLREAGVIKWASPIISFGSIPSSSVATLGLNPSNKEFVDNNFHELIGNERRFQTLRSLNLNHWSGIQDGHLNLIIDSCDSYFRRNPYDAWFKSLDNLISGTKYSYYHSLFEACHLDLVPYATEMKWGELNSTSRKILIYRGKKTLADILQCSNIALLILNGQSVVRIFSDISNVNFKVSEPPCWRLARKNGKSIRGLSYRGIVSNISGIDLGREIFVLGYNHNIQSSYGVTKVVKNSISNWIYDQVLECSI